MCGIAGFISREGAVSKGRLTTLADALAHRGPDAVGTYISPNKQVGFVHTRLSILGVDAGKQPFFTADNHVVSMVNGEIYNYKKLCQYLETKDVFCKTGSDCEPVGHLYAEEELGFRNFLHGMYGLAIFDVRKNRVLLARDPLGIKPLYYVETADGLAFASEPAALVRAEFVAGEVNESQLFELFNRQFTRGKETLFKGIQRVQPGEMLVIDEGRITQRKQHKALRASGQKQLKTEEALEQFESLFLESLRLHIQSEQPYGMFLSGGVDSSAVLHGLSKIGADMRAYTVGFTHDSVKNETTTAAQLAQRLGVNHTTVAFDETDFWQLLPELCLRMDDLVADYAVLPTLKLAQRATQDVRVILSGEGGDEIFAGYGRYRENCLKTFLRKPVVGRGSVYAGKQLFTADILAQSQQEGVPRWYPTLTLKERQRYDIDGWLPENLLQKLDRTLMASGIEGRVPLLDDALSAFGFHLPDNLKLQGQHGKWLLKEWLARQDKTFDPWAKKSGFTVPIAPWLNARKDTLQDVLLHHKALDGIVNASALEKMLQKDLSSKQVKLVFNLLCYVGWYQTHIQQKSFELI